MTAPLTTRECPACALDAPAGAPECPFCGYEFPRPRAGTRPTAWLMIALMAGAASALAYVLGWFS
ncbi:MAG TPA: zinc ribbon domain-containing protein [Rubricoccaceae bacterium]